jgi:hypothetical protein
MIKPFLAAMALALSASVALADSDLSTNAMHEHPGTMGGMTANPTAKPPANGLVEKQMQNQPGVNSDTAGMTAHPNAKPEDGSLQGKEMEINPGARK